MKPAELLKTTTASNPISDKHILKKNLRQEGKAGKVTNRLVRNAKLAPDEAAVTNVNISSGKRPIKKREIFDL